MTRLSLLLLSQFVVLTGFAQEVRTEIARQPLPPQLRDRGPMAEPERISTPILSPSSAEPASEFGEQQVLIRQAQWEPWRADAGVSGFFTDNVALAPNRVQDFFLKYDVSVGYTNRIGGPWSMDLALNQSFLRYDKYDSLDFDLSRADAGVSYQASWLGDASFFLRYTYYRLTAPSFGDEILNSHSLSAGVQKIWKISHGQQLFFGVGTEPSLAAEPAIAKRNEHSTFGGWSLRLTDKLNTQISGRVGYHESTATDRTDWNYVGLVSATYSITNYARIGISGSVAWNESNKDIFTYRNAIVGVFLGATFTF
jgi:hypothetical protein